MVDAHAVDVHMRSRTEVLTTVGGRRGRADDGHVVRTPSCGDLSENKSRSEHSLAPWKNCSNCARRAVLIASAAVVSFDCADMEQKWQKETRSRIRAACRVMLTSFASGIRGKVVYTCMCVNLCDWPSSGAATGRPPHFTRGAQFCWR